MMKFMSRLGKAGIEYESVVSIDSKATPGVSFVIHRISFGRRMDLSRRVREISRKAEFLQAGTELHEKIAASILAQEIDAMYLHWGLVSMDGLTIDGEPATAAQLLEKGPEKLTREIIGAIKEQFGLSEAERKN
jgi:hypothetical protein